MEKKFQPGRLIGLIVPVTRIVKIVFLLHKIKKQLMLIKNGLTNCGD